MHRPAGHSLAAHGARVTAEPCRITDQTNRLSCIDTHRNRAFRVSASSVGTRSIHASPHQAEPYRHCDALTSQTSNATTGLGVLMDNMHYPPNSGGHCVAPMLRSSARMYLDANNFETRRAIAVSSVLASRHFAMSGPLRPDRRGVVHSGDVASGPRTCPSDDMKCGGLPVRADICVIRLRCNVFVEMRREDASGRV
jgi:hypothetical protein